MKFDITDIIGILIFIFFILLIILNTVAIYMILTSNNIPFWVKWFLFTHGGK